MTEATSETTEIKSVPPRKSKSKPKKESKTIKTNDYIDAGANHIVLNLRPPYPQGIAHWLADAVIPGLQPAQPAS